jgi:hypothetical protein
MSFNTLMRQDFTSFKEKSARHRWRHRPAAGVWRQSDEYQPGESREQVRDLGSLNNSTFRRPDAQMSAESQEAQP